MAKAKSTSASNATPESIAEKNPPVTAEDRYRMIAEAAHSCAEMRGFLIGDVAEDWLQAEAEIEIEIDRMLREQGRLGRQLDPDFDMAGEAAPLLEQVLLAHAAPGVLLRRGWRTLSSALALLAGLPQNLRQLLRAARRGKLHVQVEVLPLKHFGDRLDRAASRLAISIVTAALIVGSAIVMTVEREPGLPGLPSFGLLGFIAADIGGIWVLFSIWRGDKG